jgi:3-oxoacyl-ACP reductase-like protein
MRLTTSKLDRLSDRSAEHVVEKPAAGKPAAAPQAAEPVRPPAPTPPAAPASRAGKISIDDF